MLEQRYRFGGREAERAAIEHGDPMLGVSAVRYGQHHHVRRMTHDALERNCKE